MVTLLIMCFLDNDQHSRSLFFKLVVTVSLLLLPPTGHTGVHFTLILVTFIAPPPTHWPYGRGSKGDCSSSVWPVGPCTRWAGGGADLFPGR